MKIIEEGYINPLKLSLSPNNVRKTNPLANIEILKESIRNIGVRNPIIINTKYQVVIGSRRWRAAKDLELSEIPYIMKEYKDDAEEVLDSLIENDLHEHPLDIELSNAVSSLYQRGMSEEKIWKILGRRVKVKKSKRS